MMPGTRPRRRVARAAPFPAGDRGSALRVVISGIGFLLLFGKVAGVVRQFKRRPGREHALGRARLPQAVRCEAQQNRLETDRSSLIRRIASAISGAIVTWRMLCAVRTASVATMLSVMTSLSIGEATTRATAPPDSTP